MFKVRVIDTLGRFVTVSAKGDNFCDFLFALLHTKPLLKRVCSVRKNLLPEGANSFLIE